MVIILKVDLLIPQLYNRMKYTSSVKELRLAFECNTKQWQLWLDPLFKDNTIKKNTKKYTPKQFKAILNLLGDPN